MRVLGADQYATNKSGNNYLPLLQVSTGQRSKLHKVVVSNLNSDSYLWIYDLAAGTIASVAPRMMVFCPGGACTTLDLSTGKPFVLGIFMVISSAPVVDATTVPASSGNNNSILDVDYRLE